MLQKVFVIIAALVFTAPVHTVSASRQTFHSSSLTSQKLIADHQIEKTPKAASQI